MTATPSARSVWLFWVFLILVIGAGLAGWFFLRPGAWVDSSAALTANDEGIGLMEQLRYAEAVEAFERVTTLAPNWLPGQINLGIALLNLASEENKEDNLNRAVALFQQVLKKDPRNPHAHYCLGMIWYYEGKVAEAYPEFQAVTAVDPHDAFSWMRCGLTHPDGPDSPASKECFEKALRLDPALNAARHNLAHHPFQRDEERTLKLLAESKALEEAHWETAGAKLVYTEMGPYAEVIGRPPPAAVPGPGPLPRIEQTRAFQVTLAAETRWAEKDDLGDDTLGACAGPSGIASEPPSSCSTTIGMVGPICFCWAPSSTTREWPRTSTRRKRKRARTPAPRGRSATCCCTTTAVVAGQT